MCVDQVCAAIWLVALWSIPIGRQLFVWLAGSTDSEPVFLLLHSTNRQRENRFCCCRFCTRTQVEVVSANLVQQRYERQPVR